MLALIDTHQHLIYPDTLRYAWTDEIPALARQAFTLEAYHALTRGTPVGASLFMEVDVDDYRAEAHLVASLAARAESGILGTIASCRPERDAGFTEWLDASEALNVVGFRRVLHVVDDGVSRTETFRRNVRAIGGRGKTFDLCVRADQLPLAAELAAACETGTLVLDHCGQPEIAAQRMDPWREDVARLAAMPHLVCKLSGLLECCAPGQATHAAIAPYVDHILETFGPRRIIWGSNWPVVNLTSDLPHWIALTTAILGQLSDDEASAIGSANARRVYGIAA